MALRDASGQFRNFDDVIMELSSKWDGLDRNTQRYIATIAAGSRQQSRFIALVEDYDRNVELLDMAQNSAGASAAQFSTQLTGLQASFNRLQSAWEGLYLSFEEGPTLFSFLIDTLAKLIQSFSDLGLMSTAIFGTLIFLFAKLALQSSAFTTKFVLNKTAEKLATDGVTNSLIVQKAMADASLKALTPYLATIGSIVLVIGALTVGIILLNNAMNRHKIAAREAAEAIQEYEGKIGAANQEISSLESLTKEYQELTEAGEDTTAVRQQIIDQFPEIAETIDVEKASYQELTDTINEYLRVKRLEAAIDTGLKVKKEEEKELEELKQTRQDLTNELIELNGQVIDATGKLPEALQEEKDKILKELSEINKEISTLENGGKNLGKSDISNIVTGFAIDNNLTGDYATDFLEAYFSDLNTTRIDEETGKITDEITRSMLNNMQNSINNIDKVMQSKDNEITEPLIQALGGDTSVITEELLEQWKNLGFDLETELETLYDQYYAQIRQERRDLASALGKEGIDDTILNIPDEILRGWTLKFQNAKDNPELTQALKDLFNFSTDGNLNLGQEIQDSLNNFNPSDIEDIIDLFALLGNSSEESAIKLKESLLPVLMETGDIAEYTSNQLGDFYSNIENLKNAVDEGLDYEEVMNLILETEGKIGAESFNLDPLTGKWKVSAESAAEYADALLEIQRAEIKQSIIAVETAIAENERQYQILLQTKDSLEAKEEEIKSYSRVANNAGIYAKILNIVATLLGKTTDSVDDEINSLLSQASTYEEAYEILDDAIKQNRVNNDILVQQRVLLDSAEEGLKNTTGAQQIATNATKSATNATDSYVDALKEQADALKEAAEAEQDRIEAEINGIKKVLEAKKEALEEENELLEEQIEKEKESQEILLEAYLKYLDKRKEEYQNSLDELEKAAEEARELADKNNEELNFTNEIAQDYYKEQISLIDEKINALNEEAEAEDRLQKLQEARDAYERAKNTKNRLVLVKGAGWVFKRDQEEINSTYDALQDAQREVEIAKLEEEKELLQQQADAWAEKAENIGKTTEELENYNKAYEDFVNLTEEQRKEALEAYIEAILKNNELNQDAANKEDIFEDQSDEEKEGTLAWNIAKIEELSEQTNELIDKIGQSVDELIKNNKIDEVVKSLDELLGNEGIEGLTNHLDTLTKGINIYLDNFLKINEQISKNENSIENIDDALEAWDELAENLGKSQSELNKELEIFNRYNQMTISQLSKNSEVYKDIASQVSNLADQWERVNAAEAAYNAAKKYSKSISSGEGYATGGVNTYTGLAAVHGTKSRPEVFLNNSQAAALFNFIENLRGFSTFSKRKNIPQSSVQNSITEDNSTEYNNCKFEIISNSNNINSLLQEIKNKSPLQKF